MKRAAGYVRVSQVGGREGESFMSPDVQREKIQTWAAYRDYHVVDWYVDLDVSGRAGVRRPEFDRMMADAREGRFDAIAVYRLTRFGRSLAEAARRYLELEQIGVDLVSVTEDIDTTTAGGKFMRNVMLAMAEFESERIGEEWRNVHAQRRQRGIAHVTRPTLGYDLHGGRLVVNEAEAPAVRRAFVLRTQGLGYAQIGRTLARDGFVTKHGHPRFPKATIAKVLANPLYAGLVRAGGELVAGQHPAIVPRDLWEAAQALAGHVAGVARHRAGLLSGLVVCSGCGFRMGYEAVKATPARRGGGPVYRCMARQRSAPCEHSVSVVAEYADEHVEQQFLRRLRASNMPHGGRLRRTRQQHAWKQQIARRRSRVDELNRALDAIATERWQKGTLAASEYERQSARFLAERAEAQEQIAELERLLAAARPVDSTVLAVWPDVPLQAKQQALRLAIASVVVRPSPRRGPGQRALMRERLEIGWRA